MRFRNPESGFGYIVVMRLSCNFVNVYTKLVNVKSPKCHVVLLAYVVALLFLAMSFVTAAIFVYTILCNFVNVYTIAYRVHVYKITQYSVHEYGGSNKTHC